MKLAGSLVLGAALWAALAAAAPPPPDPGGIRAEPATPEELLRPYYARLTRELKLPRANEGKALDRSQTLTRLAFGSCNHQLASQAAWPVIAATSPQLFLAMGDNVYADFVFRGEADLASFRMAYDLQASRPEFSAFREQVPMAATWDDHDFGVNDSGASFAFREFSEVLFENFWHSSGEVRSRPGVYDSFTMGPERRRVQVILLDTRFFRSDLKFAGPGDAGTRLGPYADDVSDAVRMLGDAQWQWLGEQLAAPADLRIVVSSIQVLSDAHHFERWGNLPRERERLFRALSKRSGGTALLLSGDRHFGAFYQDKPDALGEEIWEFTSSSLNRELNEEAVEAGEPDPLRKSPVVGEGNFGLVDIDWTRRTATMRLMRASGGEVVQQTVGF